MVRWPPGGGHARRHPKLRQIARLNLIQAATLYTPALIRGASPQIDDLVIRGYLLSIQQGSEAKRLVLGFRLWGIGVDDGRRRLPSDAAGT
jgi:hypothetical protein